MLLDMSMSGDSQEMHFDLCTSKSKTIFTHFALFRTKSVGPC